MTVTGDRGDGDLPRVAILFAQFAPYHIDRIEAAALRLAGRAEVIGVETADASTTYDWEPSRSFAIARHQTLFPGRVYERIAARERLSAYRGALADVDLLLSGIPWSEPDMIALSWLRGQAGQRSIAMTCSKADDTHRSGWREWIKARLLAPYTGGLVAATRSRAYLRGLGFSGKPIMPGYNTMSMERIRRQAAGVAATAWRDRPFVFVGRLVEKKNLPILLDAYASYARQAGTDARRLVLVGKGPLEGALRAQAQRLGIAANVEFAGHHDSAGVVHILAGALALVLPSREEQWGLVVNEAVALGIPALASAQVGACDALVRHGKTGFVVDHQDAGSLAAAMLDLAADGARWQAMAAAAGERAWMADAERFADAVELLFDPANERVAASVAKFWNACEND